MQYGPPPLFKQGIPAGLRLALYILAAVLLILVDTRLRVLDPLRSGILSVIAPVQSALESPFRFAGSYRDYFTSKGTLLLQNQELARRNEELRQEHAELLRLREENDQLRALARTESARSGARSVIAEVLGEGGDPFTRTLLLDKGLDHGLLEGMGVTDGSGLVGQISRIYPKMAEVRLITSNTMQVPVQIRRTGLRSIAEGDGETNLLHLLHVPAGGDVRPGDVLQTSGLDGVYSAGTPVGTVLSVQRTPGETFLQITVQPAGVMSGNRFLRVLLKPAALPEETEASESGWRRR